MPIFVETQIKGHKEDGHFKSRLPWSSGNVQVWRGLMRPWNGPSPGCWNPGVTKVTLCPSPMELNTVGDAGWGGVEGLPVGTAKPGADCSQL